MAKSVVGLEINVNSGQAEGSVKSLKAQLKEAQAEVGALSEKFGATSEQAVNAAKKAGALKDAIGDAKALTDAFNPDRKFQAFSSALQGVAGGFAALQGAQALFGAKSEELEKTLLKVQGAMALSQGLNSLLEAKDSFRNLQAVAVQAFKAIKNAIGSTGIGLLVVALGTIYAYWDDIKELVSGVSDEQLKQQNTLNKIVEEDNKRISALNNQDNILKLQGLNEKQILQRKIAQYATTIKDTEAQIKGEAIIQALKEKNAQRNFEITKNVLRVGLEISSGMLRLLAAPIDATLAVANKVSETLGFGKIVSSDINDQITKLNKSVSEYGASFLFDPQKVKNEGEKTRNESLANLEKLKNDKAGFELQIKEIDNKANDDKKKKNGEQAKIDKEAKDNLLKIQQENTLALISDERKRAALKLEIDLENAKKDIENSKASKELKQKQIEELEKKYMLDLQALKDKYAEDDKKKAEEKDKQEIEIWKKQNQARIDAISNAYLKAQEVEMQRYQDEIDANLALLNDKKISQEEYNTWRENAETIHSTNLQQINKDHTEAQKKIDEAAFNAKEEHLNKVSGLLNSYAEILGKNTAAGKALAVAGAVIDTYSAANQVLSAKSPAFVVNPYLRFASAAATIVTGLMNVKKILSVQVPKGGGGGANVPTGTGVSAPIAPQASSTTLNQDQVNQLSSATTRAFVLESDVSGNQERIQRLNRAARIN